MTIMPGWREGAAAPSRPTGWSPSSPREEIGVRLGDLRMATDYDRSDGVSDWSVALAELVGWWDTVAWRTERAEHPRGAGTMAAAAEQDAREIQIRGSVRARTKRAMLEAKDAVAAAGGTLVVDERPRNLSREADVADVRVLWDPVADLYERFSMTMTADDPLRYWSKTTDLVNGSNTLLNPGDADAWPVLEIPGSHGQVTITSQGATWTLAANGGGTTRIVDLREGDIWQGNARVAGLESGTAPLVPVGGGAWTIAGLGANGGRARRHGAWR